MARCEDKSICGPEPRPRYPCQQSCRRLIRPRLATDKGVGHELRPRYEDIDPAFRINQYETIVRCPDLINRIVRGLVKSATEFSPYPVTQGSIPVAVGRLPHNETSIFYQGFMFSYKR